MTMKICLTVFQCLFNGRWHKMWRWQEFMSFVVKMSLEGLLRINNKNKGVSGIFIQLNFNQTTKHTKKTQIFPSNITLIQTQFIFKVTLLVFFCFPYFSFLLEFFFSKRMIQQEKNWIGQKMSHMCIISHLLLVCMHAKGEKT